MDVLVGRLARKPVTAARNAPQVTDRFLIQLLVILEQPVENGLCQRFFELDADELLAMPYDTAILRLEPGDIEPDAAIVGNRRGAFDARAVRRNVDDANLGLASAPFAHGRR